MKFCYWANFFGKNLGSTSNVSLMWLIWDVINSMMQKDPSLALFLYTRYLWFILPESFSTLLLLDLCPWRKTIWTSWVDSLLSRFLLGSANSEYWVGGQKVDRKRGQDIYSSVVLSVALCQLVSITSSIVTDPGKVDCSIGISLYINMVTFSFLVSLAVV